MVVSGNQTAWETKQLIMINKERHKILNSRKLVVGRMPGVTKKLGILSVLSFHEKFKIIYVKNGKEIYCK